MGSASGSPQHTALVRAAALCQQNDWLGAEPVLREALERFSGADTDDVWQMRLLYSDALTALGKYEVAIAVLRPKPPPRLVHSPIAIRRLTNQAVLAYRTSTPDDAQRLMNEAESLARRYQQNELTRVLVVRAGVECARHEDAAAKRHAHQAIVLSRKSKDPRMEMNALGTLARTQTFEGRYDEAIDANVRALALANQIKSPSKIQKMSGNLAWAYILLGDFDTATDYLTKAIPIAEKTGEAFDLCSWQDNLGKIAMYRRDYRTAIAYFQRSTAVARRVNLGALSEFIDDSAEALLELGDIGAARKASDEARSLIDAKNEKLQLRSLLIDARIDAKSGQIDSAITKVRRVVGAANAAFRWEAEARLAQFLIAAKRRNEAGEQFRRAIETAAEVRGKIKEEELRLPFGALVREINEQYVDFLLGEARVDEAFAVVERSRAQTLDDALDRGAERRIDPQQIAADRDAVILSYWLTPERSYVWTITPNSIEVTPLPAAAAIESALDTYSQEILSSRTGKTSMPHGAALYTMLVQPVAKRIPAGKRVIIVPDGRLHAFNMETLVVPSTHRYWIENVTIEMAGSLELLAGSRTARASRSLLLVGDPPPAGEFLRLNNAEKEMALVSRHFPEACTTLKGARATPRSYLKAGADRYGYIHFVAHAIAPRLQPLDSAVILAPDTSSSSYKLYARDVLKHTLRARLVTISSCQGAGTRTYTGEGLVGLAWAFLHAGARQVIAALWEVNDDATPKLMDDLYAGIRRGQDPAAALRNAKLRLIQSHQVYRYPKYWAPFVIYSGS